MNDYKVMIDFHSSLSPLPDEEIMGAIGSFFTYIRNGLRLGVNGNNEFPVSQELVLALLLKYLAKEDVDTRKVVKFFLRSSEGHIHEVPKKELEEGKHFPGLLKEATSTD